jgi:hypothetical protein
MSRRNEFPFKKVVTIYYISNYSCQRTDQSLHLLAVKVSDLTYEAAPKSNAN